jgi:hypothetical protein
MRGSETQGVEVTKQYSEKEHDMTKFQMIPNIGARLKTLKRVRHEDSLFSMIH